jgi:REP element-mobilizing transposase RayT
MGDFQSINWRSRGYLPHFDAQGMQQHIVFGLADSLPCDHAMDQRDALTAYDAMLDRNIGRCALRDPVCASSVQQALLHGDGRDYRLLAWCVMPNHVHVVIEQDGELAGTVRRWKTWSARRINARLNTSGRVWRREYFDRFARNEKQLGVMIEYVENNPVAAGLISTPEAWTWSSAGHRR